MLPNLSRLRLHANETPSTEYQASNRCPEPAGAGDLSKGVNVQSGSSPPFQLATDAIASVTYAQNAHIDWKNGTQDLAEPTTFIHIATAGLPVNLRDGTKLRTQLRMYAHTDIKNWTWRGGDRVIIHWPKGMPFQIMGTLNNSDANNTPYQRSCKLLSNKDPVVLKPNKQGDVTWPYANVAIVLPPTFYSVIGTPQAVRTPKQLVANTFEQEGWSASVVDAARRGVEMPQLEEHKWNRNATVFTSSSEEDLKVILSVFERLNSPYQQYELSLTSEVSDAQKKRKAALVAVGIASSNLTYKLTVSRTCMYEETHVQAHYIDLSGYVRGSAWRPKDWAFYNPYKNVKNRTKNAVVLLNGSLKMQVYLEMWMYAKDDALDNLRIAYDDILLDDALDMETVQLETFTPMQLRGSPAAEFRDQSSYDQQEAVVRAFIHRFQTLQNENQARDLAFAEFATRCEYLAVAAGKLLEMVSPDAMKVEVRDVTRPLFSYDYSRTLPQVFKELIDMTEERPIVHTLLQAVSKNTVQYFQDDLFEEFDKDADVYWMRVMKNKYHMRPPTNLNNFDDLFEAV